MDSCTGMHPPRPRLTLNVGVTGHRAQAIDESLIAELLNYFDSVFSNLAVATHATFNKAGGHFTREPPLMRLHTALATGADQLAATSARKHGYELRAMLPFPPKEYERDFPIGQEHTDYRQHFDKVDGFFALPGTREAEEDAYVLVGKAIIAAADIVIAVWDGKGARGPGGTAHVVDLALRGGIPVIHIPLNRDHATLGKIRLLAGGDAVEPVIAPLVDSIDLEEVVSRLLLPIDVIGVDELDVFLEENSSSFNPRIEFPLMLAMLGVKRVSTRPWRQPSLADAIKNHAAANHVKFKTQSLAYEWANFLAIRYAQLFRSSHVTNYLLSALAVLIALAGLMVPSLKFFLVLGELCILSLLYINTRIGSQGAWHRKWLQYRHLAESLRSLSYLKQTGLIGPPSRRENVFAVRGREAVGDWTRWYAAAIWREMPSTRGLLDEPTIRELAEEVRNWHIKDQISYHRSNAARMHDLDHRLHLVGELIMTSVIIACCLYLLLSVFAHGLVIRLTPFFVFVTAGFPALGAAVFGLRGHGEHLLASSRSASTAKELAANSEELAVVTNIEDLARELENTAQIMLSDLNEWTVAYSERSLQVPG
ncbi:hypothetical protein GRI89_14955 [Altererythrobacter salegens]|uniref:SMODS and SLOG-associating 2TM effector domain-containing protein n=1 Tax=Croceibacterium salegens TaxID=1737568 RepID=A0A6I4SZK8_9SPHN|nr:hypothetical protein [Croceibacterium salegens]MXO60839.1 hypothetical protein [Croceibacterium salegens]